MLANKGGEPPWRRDRLPPVQQSATSRGLHQSATSRGHRDLHPRLLRFFSTPLQYKANKSASAGNRTRATSMATIYSTTRPLMLVKTGGLHNLLVAGRVWGRVVPDLVSSLPCARAPALLRHAGFPNHDLASTAQWGCRMYSQCARRHHVRGARSAAAS